MSVIGQVSIINARRHMTQDHTLPDTALRHIVRWGLYPASWAVVLCGFHRITAGGHDPRMIWGQTVGLLLPIYLLIEITLPYQKRWAMTLRSFISDLKYVIFNAGAVAAISAGLALFTITISGTDAGPATMWPVGPQLMACLLIFEVVNYSLHRAMHQMRGTLGRFLWHSHAAHHLPPRLCLVMHAVFHPVNAVLIQGCAITLPIRVMGYGPKAVAMAMPFQGIGR
jgi:sterol desaturase/sphingolipid hydroxylase (fatty acid hydroxylase superfamily)